MQIVECVRIAVWSDPTPSSFHVLPPGVGAHSCLPEDLETPRKITTANDPATAEALIVSPGRQSHGRQSDIRNLVTRT